MNEKRATGVRIRVPASTSNLGSAFDSVGLALQLYLTLEMRRLDRGPSRMEFSGEDAHLIPTDASNLVWRTMEEIAAEAATALPFFSAKVNNQIPITKGLGSSAAAGLAAAAAVNFLCGLEWPSERLLELVALREGHPDNASPSLWGGLVASIGGKKILCTKSAFPQDWTIVAVTPDFELETKLGRSILPDRVSRQHAVFNVQRAAFLMAQLVRGRREGLREAMSDRLHQSYRVQLLPGLKEVLTVEDCEGLLGVALSGAGPTVVALADSHEAEIGARISDIFRSRGISARTRLLKADNTGLVVEPLF
jgi:homoserine kinase